VKALDRRLLACAREARRHIASLVALGMMTAGLVIAQAQLLADAIAGAFGGEPLRALRGALAALAVVLAARALAAWASQAVSCRAGAAVKSRLRRRLLAHAVGLGPGWLAGQRGGELVTLATQGIDALDGYFAAYLPALMLAVVVPLAVLARIASADLVAGATVAVTLPLIPFFGALVGAATGQQAARRYAALAGLAHHFLDVVTGLATLKVFGRASAQARSIATVTDDYRRATMGTLRLAFLSSLVLELAATLSVALVAAGAGLGLLYGHLDLRTGLIVLILAPEAYLPLRRVAAQFHASADGLAAAGKAFAVLETPAPEAGHRPAPVPAVIRVEGVTVDHPSRPGPAPDRVSLTLLPGVITAVAGPSGCGKSTLVAVLLGFARPSAGRVIVEGEHEAADLAEISPDSWRSLVAWVPQHPVLFPGTVAGNIRLGAPGAHDAEVAAAARAAALDEVGLDTPVAERGAGLSAGQRRKVALARALLPGRPVLLLDEPTAGLDRVSETRALAALRSQAAAGRAVLVVTHRPAVLAAADTVADLSRAADAPAT
jgi:thiol reductant ABC exporter CydD subunit